MITVRVPGDKSISHRALMLAPLAAGRSRLRGLSPGADVQATAAAMRALGARFEDAGEGAVNVEGPTGLRTPDGVIDCGNSGTTARLLLGLLAGSRVRATLDGDASLRRRPMDRVLEPLRAAGAAARGLERPAYLPVEVSEAELRPIDHTSPMASAQVKSALILAALTAKVSAEVREPGPSRDHTERMLRAMGVGVKSEPLGEGRKVTLPRWEAPLRPLDLRVPGDFSSAAFWVALAVLGGLGDAVRIEGVGLNPGRTGFLGALAAMGSPVEIEDQTEEGGEPVGTLVARPARLRGLELPPGWMPTLLDEIPMLAGLAACASGRTTITGAAELRVKESDRLALLSRNLDSLGVSCEELPDGLVVEGTDGPLRGRVATAGDHRMAMAFGVLGAVPGNQIEIDDRGSVAVSYPGFWEELGRYTGRR